MVLAVAGFAPAAEIIEPSEVAPGTRGVCLTEMDGGEMVEIPVTVLGTVGPYAPDQELVLIRLEDPRFADTGIIAGMSGSPVYVDGRLLGALAYGWGFSLEPIGGVTPFNRMVELGQSPGGAASGATVKRPELVELVDSWRTGRLDDVLVEWLAPEPAGSYRSLPLAISMAGPGVGHAAGWIGEIWDRRGWVSGPPAASEPGSDAGDLRPGAMVAGVLVDGDVTLGAGGTVTEVRGDQVWAFGHPFLGGGDVQIPLARAGVVTILPSQLSSFKFFTVGGSLGALEADRRFGVWGRLGVEVPMVPVSVTVDGRSYAFRSIRHETLLPSLVGYLANSSLEARGRTFGNQTVAMNLDIKYADGNTARLDEVFVGGDAGLQAAGMVAAAVGYLENSFFTVPAIDRIQIDISATEGLEASEIVSATPERWVVAPGETLPVNLRLRSHRGGEFTRTLEIEIPATIAEGRLDLIVADGSSWTVYDLNMRPAKPASFANEVDLFGRLVSSRHIVLALERREAGVTMAGGPMSLPPSLVAQLRAALGGNLDTTEYAVVGRVEEEMPTVVAGAERLHLTVRSDEWEVR